MNHWWALILITSKKLQGLQPKSSHLKQYSVIVRVYPEGHGWKWKMNACLIADKSVLSFVNITLMETNQLAEGIGKVVLESQAAATWGRHADMITITITGPKVDRTADATLWGAKRLRDYALYDHFLITKILMGCQERGGRKRARALPLPTSSGFVWKDTFLVPIACGWKTFLISNSISFRFRVARA